MEFEKRKRVYDGEAMNGKRGKSAEAEVEVEVEVEALGGVKTAGVPPLPGDEEVEEFYAILKRIQVALKYFKKRNAGGREMTAASSSSREPPWRPLFQAEDFDGEGEKAPEKPDRSRCAVGLDLNSDPDTEVPD